MGIGVLGPLTVDDADGIGPRDRVVLEVLAVRSGTFVAPEVMADALWGESLPASWNKVIQGCVARLRKQVGAGAIETSAYGYRLVHHEDQLDAHRFERLLRRARQHLDEGDSERASYVVGEALGLWRGWALPDVGGWEPGRTEAERLEGLRMDAQELRVQADIAAGRSRAVLDDARTLVTESPYRERRWGLFARALYLSGRQTEALDVFQRARRLLRDELGLDPGPELVALEEAILRQDPALATVSAVPASEVCPYRGLLPYETEDADTFFGRDADIASCLDRLRRTGALAVVGPSGSGKSSLVRAGLTPALQRDGSTVVVTTPGARPLDSLARVPKRGRPTLVVDQAEEAITLCTDPAMRASYFEALAAYDGPLLIALRADRLGDLSAYPDFARVVERGLYLLAGMSEANLRAAVEGPARQAGLRLESGLVDLLIREVEGEPGALPLLSHVLRQTWERREGPTLSVDGYRATGGVRNALTQSAEKLYSNLDEVQQDQARALFLRLVMPSENGDPVRARVARRKLAVDASHERLIETLVGARLVSSDEGDLQIAHEALAREWPRLRDWLEADVEGQSIFRHLAGAAEAWEAMGRPGSELYRGVRLASTLDWAARSGAKLTPSEQAFLDASEVEADRERLATERRLTEQRRSNRRLRLSLAGVAILLVASMVAGLFAVRESDRARRNEREMRATATTSQAHRLSLQAANELNLPVALLLAVEANRLEDTLTTRNALLDVLAREPRLAGPVGPYQDNLRNVAVSPDGTRIAVARPEVEGEEARGLLLLDAASGSVLAESPYQAESLRFVDDEALAVGLILGPNGEAGVSNPVRLVDADTLEPLAEQPVADARQAKSFSGIAVSGDGRWLAATLEEFDDQGRFLDIWIVVWDLRDPTRRVFSRRVDRFAALLALSPDGDRLFFAPDGQGVVQIFDVRSGRELTRHELAGVAGLEGGSGALSPEGNTIALALGSDIALLDARTLEVVNRWSNQDGKVSRPVFSPDSKRLVTLSSEGEGGFVVWEVDTGRQVLAAGHFPKSDFISAAFDDTGQTLYTSGPSGLQSWSLRAKQGLTPEVSTEPIGRTVVGRSGAPGGRLMLYVDSAGADPGNFLAQIHDTRTGRLVDTVQYRKDPGHNWIGWRSDGERIVATMGRQVLLWSPRDGTQRASVDLGVDHVTSAHFLPGNRIFVMSQDGRVLTVDAESLTDIRPVADLGRPMAWAAAASDGRHALAITEEGELVSIDVTDGSTRPIAVGGEVFDIVPAPRSDRIFLDTSEGAGIYDVRAESWVVGPRDMLGCCAVFDAEERFLATMDSGSVTLWQGGSQEPYVTVPVPSKAGTLIGTIDEGTAELVVASGDGEIFRWKPSRSAWIDQACATAGRNLNRGEWDDLVGDTSYHQTCPQFPTGE